MPAEKPSDEFLAQRVKDVLISSGIPAFSQLKVLVLRQTALLEGTLTSGYELMLALQYAGRVNGVEQVKHRIYIKAEEKPPEPTWRDAAGEFWTDYRRQILGGLSAAVLLLGFWFWPRGEAKLVPVYPATGTVHFADKAVPGALVQLHPIDPQAKQFRPQGNVGQDGKFAVTTFTKGDGAPVGEYVVTVVWHEMKSGPDGTELGPNLMPVQYSRPESSPLRVKIEKKENELSPLIVAADGLPR